MSAFATLYATASTDTGLEATGLRAVFAGLADLDIEDDEEETEE
jgi:hypothetical protein